MPTVEKIQQNGLCSSCGICKATCPTDAIKMIRKQGAYVPQINASKCIDCGLCFKLCPGRGFDYTNYYRKNKGTSCDFYSGSYMEIINAKTRNQDLLKNTVSGGVVSELVVNLIDSGEYKYAFLVDTYNYEYEVKSNKFTIGDDINKTTKSRYIPVSHENTIKYILENSSDKIVVVATSCCVHGILNVISHFGLDRDKYFIIGLFCDMTMRNNVYQYFGEHPGCEKELDKLYFRHKDAGGWPGNVRLEYTDGTYTDLSNKERMKIKEYFMLEKCLYCLDKLNQFADISIGDNYTNDILGNYGSSSVIIRTQRGQDIFEMFRDKFEYISTSMNAVMQAQGIESRKLNSSYIRLKNCGYLLTPFVDAKVDKSIRRKYKNKLKKIRVGNSGRYKMIIEDISKSDNKSLHQKVKHKIIYLINKMI